MPRFLPSTLRRVPALVGFLGVAFLTGGSAAAQPPGPKVAHPPGAYATVNGARIWYESEGRGEPLLLIAGGPGVAHGYFHPFFSALSDSFRIIYFDAFGRGRSDRAKSPREYSLERDVEDVEGLRKALGLGKINLLGHSYGGIVAQAYALRYPGSLKRLILACTLFDAEMWQANNDNCNAEIRNQFPEVWAKLLKLRAEGLQSSDPRHQDLYGTLPPGLFYFRDASQAARIAPVLNSDVYYQIAGGDADFLIGGEMNAFDFRRDLRQLRMPTLIVAGRFDRVALPRFAIQFRQYAPQARFVMMENAGHYPFVEDSAATFRELRSFLRR
jgi:proline iminopeptidase